MSLTLNQVERRVLGVLLEKALAQPQYYPMTLNAILAACNQKSNRDPVLDLTEETVWKALEVMRAGGLVTRLLPGGAGRVERFKHEAQQFFAWEKPQRAVMAELLLRGPQTTGELRGHCARLFPFESPESVQAVLDTLAQRDVPHVATLPRVPGQSAVRFAHCLYPSDEWARMGASPATTTMPEAPPATTAPSELAALQAAVDSLRSELAELRAEVRALRAARPAQP